MAKKKTDQTKKKVSQEPTPLTTLLNHCSVLFTIKAATPSELAVYMDREFARVHEWVSQRKVKPNGEATLQIREFVAKKLKGLRGPRREEFDENLKKMLTPEHSLSTGKD